MGLEWSLGVLLWRQAVAETADVLTLHIAVFERERELANQAKDPSETPILLSPAHKNGMVYRNKSFGQVNKNSSTILLRIKGNGDIIEDL